MERGYEYPVENVEKRDFRGSLFRELNVVWVRTSRLGMKRVNRPSGTFAIFSAVPRHFAAPAFGGRASYRSNYNRRSAAGDANGCAAAQG